MAHEDLPVSQADNSSAEPETDGEVTVTAGVSRTFSGPLPPATEFASYEHVLPGAADRIVSMAESYAKHTQELENEAMRQERNDRLWARVVAALVVLAVLISCLYALHLDKEDFAISLGSWTIVALAAVFVAGKVPDWIRKTER